MNELLLIVMLLGSRGTYRTFTAGEITPDLYGRTDVQEVSSVARIIDNMFVWPHGPVEKRPGTYFIAQVATATPADPGSDPVPPAQIRDEAFAVAAFRCVFYDEAWNELVSDAHTGTTSVSVDANGVTVFGGTNQANPVRRYDADMNVDTSFYTPASGTWGAVAGAIGTEDLFFSADGGYLYVVITRETSTHHKYIYKFRATTGVEEWNYVMRWRSYSAVDDSAGNFYIAINGTSGQPWNPPHSELGIVVFDEDGTPFEWWEQGVGYSYDMWIDEALSLLIGAGTNDLRISELDGSSYTTHNQSSVSYGCITKGNFIYWCGRRRDTGNGTGSYIKSDVDGNTIAVYDPGGNKAGGYMFLDHNDVVCGKGWFSTVPANSEDETIYEFDDDLDLITSYSLTTAGLSDSSTGGEAAIIPFFDAGVPGTPAAVEVSLTPDDGTPPARLIPFASGIGISRIIEAGANYMRFYKDVP